MVTLSCLRWSDTWRALMRVFWTPPHSTVQLQRRLQLQLLRWKTIGRQSRISLTYWDLSKDNCLPDFRCLRQNFTALVHLGMAGCFLQQNSFHTVACPLTLQGSHRPANREEDLWLLMLSKAAKTSILPYPGDSAWTQWHLWGADNSVESSWVTPDF